MHLPGKENIVAVCLSRPPTLPPTYTTPPPALPVNATAPVSLFPLPLSYIAIAKAQATCPSIPALVNNSSLTITSIPISPDLQLLGDVSTPIFRPLVPLSFQKPLVACFLLGLSGHICLLMSPFGLASVYLAKKPKFTNTSHRLLQPFLYLNAVFHTYM